MTVLIAGVGNIFLGDDGFGVEVVTRLDPAELPEDTRVVDYGIRGLHLAYDLLGGYDTTILIDATPRGGEPGTLYVIEADTETDADPAALDAHGMHPQAVLGLLRLLGGQPGRVLVVGCEPECAEERIGLSEAVRAAVPRAVRAVTDLAGDASLRARTTTTEV